MRSRSATEPNAARARLEVVLAARLRARLRAGRAPAGLARAVVAPVLLAPTLLVLAGLGLAGCAPPPDSMGAARGSAASRSSGTPAQAALPATPDGKPLRLFPEPRSGVTFAGAEVRAMQADDSANPGMLWVERGAQLWRERAGAANRACRDCHGDADVSMRGVSAHYPQYDTRLGRLLNVEARINNCRTEHMRAEPLAYESEALLGLTAFVATQSRGVPIQVSIDGPAREHFEAGRRLYYTRMGQINLACTNCHEQSAGKRLLAETISQGQPNDYPIYRLSWQTMGSLHRRFRSCYSGVRAEMLPQGAPEYLDLELFLAWRAMGLKVETPGVRR